MWREARPERTWLLVVVYFMVEFRMGLGLQKIALPVALIENNKNECVPLIGNQTCTKYNYKYETTIANSANLWNFLRRNQTFPTFSNWALLPNGADHLSFSFLA